MSAYNMRVGANAVIIEADRILLIAFQDDLSGFHYNLPGGGITSGEIAEEALRREVREEVCAEITVGRLLFITEYEPIRAQNKYGTLHKLGLIYECRLTGDSRPHLPDQPDAHQIGVEWLPLGDLSSAPLLPLIADRIMAALGHLSA